LKNFDRGFHGWARIRKTILAIWAIYLRQSANVWLLFNVSQLPENVRNSAGYFFVAGSQKSLDATNCIIFRGVFFLQHSETGCHWRIIGVAVSPAHNR
jgi:hypothetical protein